MKTEFQALQEAIVKSGEIAPGALSIGGLLRPERANRIVDLIIDHSDILKRVTVERTKKLSKEVDVLEVAGKILTRIPQGQDPDKYVGVGNVGPTLEMRDHQLFGRILFDALRDNKDDPQYETKVLDEWTKAWSRDVTRLAWSGTHDDYVVGDVTKGAFEHLNMGWLQILKGAESSNKVDRATFVGGSPAVLDYLAYLTAIVEALPDEFKGPTCKIMMSQADLEAYILQVGQMSGGVGYLIQGGVSTYLGYEILPQQYMPRGEVVFTPLANLVYGINTEIERFREVRGTKRCIDYTFDAADDFQVVLSKAAVIGFDVPTP